MLLLLELTVCYCAIAINYELECAGILNRVVVIIDGNTDFVALTL